MDDKYKKLVDTLPKESEDLWFEYNLAVNKIIQENQQLHNKMDELEKYSRGNIEACENRLNSPFCNFERVTKELMIHKNYLEILKEHDVDEK